MKRKLTKPEIRDILSAIKIQRGLPVNIQKYLHQNLVKNIIQPLMNIEIEETQIENLKKEILRQYYAAIIQPGENVGIIAAQSIGEKNTQITLDTFHTLNTGINTVLTGIPRIKELCDTTHKQKMTSCDVYLLNEEYVNDFSEVVFEHLVDSYNIQQEEKEDWLNDFEFLFSKTPNDCTVIRCRLDKKKLFQHRIKLYQIKNVLEHTFYSIFCSFGPHGSDIFYIYIEKIEFPNMNIFDSQEEGYKWYIEDILLKILSTKICGITGIKSIYRNTSIHIITEGSNLQEILTLPFVDKTRTVCNYLWEIYEIFGIEAARQFLINELVRITSEGGYINIKHIEVLVNSMVQTGTILPITCQTMKNNDSSVLSKISFEEPVHQLVKAAFHKSVDHLNDSTSNIIIGKTIKSGSGMMDLLIDLKKLK